MADIDTGMEETFNRSAATSKTSPSSKPPADSKSATARHDHTSSNPDDSRTTSHDPAPAMLPARILSVSWGQIEVEGSGKFKDLKIWPGGCRAWDWGETGTRHSPGIQVADVEELLSHGATVVVLSRGMEERLGVPESTVDALRARGVEIHVAETKNAVALYNDLAKSASVAGLFHSTC